MCAGQQDRRTGGEDGKPEITLNLQIPPEEDKFTGGAAEQSI
jgi:hypothetical protein